MSFSMSIRSVVRQPRASILSGKRLSTSSGMMAKSPVGEAISQVAKAEGGTAKGSKSAAMQSKVTKAFNENENNEQLGGKGQTATGAVTEAGSSEAKRQSQVDREANFEMAAAEVESKLAQDPSNVTAEDAAYVKSREARAFGKIEKGGISAAASRAADGKT